MIVDHAPAVGSVLACIDRVPALPGAPEGPRWRRGYQAMIVSAAGRGWIAAETNAIRAKVERRP